jgi:hypothetical protein
VRPTLSNFVHSLPEQGQRSAGLCRFPGRASGRRPKRDRGAVEVGRGRPTYSTSHRVYLDDDWSIYRIDAAVGASSRAWVRVRQASGNRIEGGTGRAEEEVRVQAGIRKARTIESLHVRRSSTIGSLEAERSVKRIRLMSEEAEQRSAGAKEERSSA